MTEEQAIEIVEKHGRYQPTFPENSCYSVRWPTGSPRALFAKDTRELVEKLLNCTNNKHEKPNKTN